jgi:hypothetical protein
MSMISEREAQELHELIGFALEEVENGHTAFVAELERAHELAAIVVSDTTSGDGELVVFHWTRHHGDCYGCGLPAAFYIESVTGDAALRCAVCAANAAVDGETVHRIAPCDAS